MTQEKEIGTNWSKILEFLGSFNKKVYLCGRFTESKLMIYG